MGFGANSVSTYSIVATMDEDDREKNIGIMAATYGLGMLTGPLIGGCCYEAFGFSGVFLVFVIAGVIMLPFMYILLSAIPPAISENEETEDNIPISFLC